MDFSNILDTIEERVRAPITRSPMQLRSIEICDQLGISSRHYGQMMRWYKHRPDLCERIFIWQKDYPNPKHPLKLFAWKMKQLKLNSS